MNGENYFPNTAITDGNSLILYEIMTIPTATSIEPTFGIIGHRYNITVYGSNFITDTNGNGDILDIVLYQKWITAVLQLLEI